MELQPKTIFIGKMYPTKVRIRPESAPSFAARSKNQIVTAGKRYPQIPREKGRAISATGIKRLCEREKLQKSHAEPESELLTLRDDYAKLCSENQHINLERDVSDRRRAKKQAWIGDGKNMDQVDNYYNQDSRWIEREADYRTQIDNLTAEIQRLRSRYDEVKSNLDEERRGHRDIRAKYENYALESYKSEQQLKKQIRELEKTLTVIVDQKKQAERDLKKERREHLTKKDQELQRVSDEKEQLLQQVKDTDSMEVLNLQRELTNVRQELEEIRVDNSALHHEKQLLQNKNYQMEEKMKMDQENKSDEQKMVLFQLQREVAALQREKSDLIKNAEQVKSNNESQVRQQREQIDKIKIESNGKDKLLKEKDNKLKEHERVQSGMTADAAKLSRKYESVMSKNKNLHGQVKELTSRCQNTADENVALRSKTERGRSADRELSHLKQEIKDIQKKQTSVTLERDTLQSENKKLTKMFNNQKYQNQLLGKEVQAVKEEVERLDSDNKELQRQNQQLLLTKESSTQEYKQTSAAAKGKIEMLQREMSDLRKRTADSEERVTSASKTIRELEWEKGIMEAKIKELNKQIQELKPRQDSYTQKYQQMFSAAEETRNLQREITGLHKRIADADGSSKSALEKMQQEKEKIEAENQKQKEQIRNLNERQESQTQEYHGMDAAFAKEKEKLQREITTLRYHEKDSELTVKSALDRVQEDEGEKAQLKAEIQRQTDQIQDLKIRHATQRQDNQQVSAAAKEEKDKLKREITDLLKHTVDSDVISKSVAEKVQTAEREKTRLEADIQRYKDQIQELNTQNIQQVRREKQLKTDLDTQSKNYQEAQKELSGVKKELYAVKQQIEKERSSLQSQIERQESYKQMYQQMSVADEEKEKLQREITDLKKHIAHLEAEAQRNKDQKQELTKRCEEIEQVWRDIRHTLKPNEEIMEKCSPRHAQVVMDISPREMAMRLGEVYRKIDEMLKRDKSQTDKTDADEEDLSILSDLKELLQKYYTLLEKKYQNNEVVNDVLDQEFLEVLPAVRNKFQMFSQSFFEICRDMFSLTPPPRLEFGDGMKGSSIDKELFNCYKKPGEVVDYVIWPALVSRCDDSVYGKGIVKPQVLTK